MDERKKLGTDNLLPEAILMDTSKVYADIAEKITGEKIVISENPKEEIVKILEDKYGLINKGEKRKSEAGA
jgi:phosphoribosylaminoimidazole-succinocarboxamide synthase